MRTLFYGVLCPLVVGVGILGNLLCLGVLSSPQFTDFMYIFLKVIYCTVMYSSLFV
jgi:hypothetical protein